MLTTKINIDSTMGIRPCFLILATVTLVLLSLSTKASVAGKTILAKGDVIALDQKSGETRSLKRRSVIYNVDEITTGKLSRAQFNMADAGLITLKENSKLLINDYQYNKETKKGSATLELVSGGLRSISGLIKKTGGDYQVKTPVGSIGIRGTHFAVQVVGDNVVFGVYSGNIDVTLQNNQVLSLGVTEDFSFASVDAAGKITQMTQAPQIFSKGFVDITKESTALTNSEASVEGLVVDASLYNESDLQGISDDSIAELISQRTGTLNYNQVTQSSITSSVGETNGFSMNMVVDFDQGSVPGGTLTFSDEQGQWFAAYSGLINIDKLELGVNFASHGNNKAEGNISAAFANGLDEILGNFNLSEINDPTVNAGGTYKIKP
ncbi:FecR family protein [Thalassotalea piscium]